MGLYEFSMLSRDARMDVVFMEGQFLASRLEESLKAVLYKMNSFFVEVYYDPSTNQIIKSRTFVTHKLLEPYAPSNLLDELSL